MKYQNWLVTFATILFSLPTYSQFALQQETDFLSARKYVVAIGTVITVPMSENGKVVMKKSFVDIGSGLTTYLNFDTTSIANIITARHVVNFFVQNHLKSVFIRPAWADTLRTTDYFGIEIPLYNGLIPNIFFYPEERIDLASIIMPQGYFDSISIAKYNETGASNFPYNNMISPFLGEQVWMYGYPAHVEVDFESRFLYNIATLKPGYIAWRPENNFSNQELNHITLVESNATHGNSGGPVFSFRQSIELVGILVGGYPEADTVKLNDKPIFDSVSKQTVLSIGRSGVSIIEKAEYVKKMAEYVQVTFNSLRKKYKF